MRATAALFACLLVLVCAAEPAQRNHVTPEDVAAQNLRLKAAYARLRQERSAHLATVVEAEKARRLVRQEQAQIAAEDEAADPALAAAAQRLREADEREAEELLRRHEEHNDGARWEGRRRLAVHLQHLGVIGPRSGEWARSWLIDGVGVVALLVLPVAWYWRAVRAARPKTG